MNNREALFVSLVRNTGPGIRNIKAKVVSKVSQVDWNKIKLKYVSSNMNYRQLAEACGVQFHEVRMHGKDEDWVNARKEYRAKLFERAQEKAVERQAITMAKLMTASEKTADVIEELAGNKEYFFPEMTDMNGVVRKNFSGRDLREFTIAIRELTGTIRDLYGIPSKLQKEKFDMEKEKWELEKRIKERELENDNTSRIEVVIAKELDDYTV